MVFFVFIWKNRNNESEQHEATETELRFEVKNGLAYYCFGENF